MKRARDIFRDEQGVTTVGMAVSLLVCLSLLFSGAQLYRASSASAEVQEVADSAALAAESEVAEFMVAVRTCDAMVLSMTLLAGTAYGIGIVAACIPPAAAVSEQLVDLGSKVVRARDEFSQKASDGLERLQAMLPFLASASAASVAAACNEGAMQASYYGLAVLLPEDGEPISVDPQDGLSDIGDQVESDAPSIREDAEAAEEAAERAAEAKEKAYQHDCGDSPGYCQYERAGRFSWMPDSKNPYFASVDTWSFEVALQRAKDYYQLRRYKDVPDSSSVEDMARYNLRCRFYTYAAEELERHGYVHDGEDGFEANFPKLFKNVSEFRESRLYEEAKFPVTGSAMHAYNGCPECGRADYYASISALESGEVEGCDVCGFTIESIGNVASASTNIPNGFEHHYEAIRQAAIEYQEARSELDPLNQRVKDAAQPLLDRLGELFSEIGGHRIEATPPGASGAICIVVNTASNAADTGFESAFVSGGTTLGKRAAVSGAALVEDASDDSSNVITSLLDGFGTDGGAAVGGARIVLDCWSGLLKAYENGQAALVDAVSSGLDSIPLATLSGLGTWAEGALTQVVDAAGLAPAQLKALKPALLNTGHVAAADDGAFAVRFKQAKQQSLEASQPTGDLVSVLAAVVPDAVSDAINGATITIAEVEFPIGGVCIPIEIALPPAVGEAASGLVGQAIQAIGSAGGSILGVRQWE